MYLKKGGGKLSREENKSDDREIITTFTSGNLLAKGYKLFQINKKKRQD